jgi:hypothetical protein
MAGRALRRYTRARLRHDRDVARAEVKRLRTVNRRLVAELALIQRDLDHIGFGSAASSRA